MRQARAGHDTCGQRVTPRYRWARAWPDNESTRRAKLAARTAHGRVATHRHTQRPGTTGVEGAGGTGGHGRASRQRTETHTSMPVAADVEGRRRDRRAWLRCPWAAAGPGRHHTAPKAPPAWRAPEGPVGLTAVPVGGGGAWTAPHSTEGATGVEGAGGTRGPDCGARGRWRGLAGLRDDAPSRRLAARTARGRATAHGNNQQPGPAGRAKRPARQHTTRRHKKHSTGARAHRPAPLDATTQTRQLRSTCVPYRSARAARRSR